MDNKSYLTALAGALSLFISAAASASIVIPMTLIAKNETPKKIGSVTVDDAVCGVLLTPQLHNLPPGVHGFHIHEYASCDDNGMAAGNHLDPAKTEKHRGPYDHSGHKGDLPVLIVNADGTATLPTLAPQFKLKQLKGHTLMIHAGTDNYSDTPEKNGGGGERYACGVIE